MFRRTPSVAYLFLLASGVLGAWMVGLFEGESKTKEVTGLDLLLALFGLLIFVGAIIAAVVLMSRRRKPMTEEQGIAWEHIRSNGKWSYVRSFALRGSLPIVVSMATLGLWEFWTDKTFEGLKLYAILTLVLIGCVFYAASKAWDYWESEYNLLHSEPQQNKRLQPTAR